MAANLRFSTAIEALVLMASAPEQFHTSQALAETLETNPVVVRRLLSALSQADLVTSVKGPSGGTRLARGPKQITLRDIYRALGPAELLHRSPHHAAKMRDLREAMSGVFRKAEKSLESELDATTLNQLMKKSGKRAAKDAKEKKGAKSTAASPEKSSPAAEIARTTPAKSGRT